MRADPNKIAANQTLSDTEFNKRLAQKRRLRADINRQNRLARRAMFKFRNDPSRMLAAQRLMENARMLGQRTGLETTGGIQSYEALRNSVFNDMAREIDFSNQVLGMQEAAPQPTPSPAPRQDFDDDTVEQEQIESTDPYYLQNQYLQNRQRLP